MAYKYIFFDADNTLYDFNKAEASALRESIIRMGNEWDDSLIPLYHEINDKLWKDFEKKLIDTKRLRVERFEILKQRAGLDYDSSIMSPVYVEALSHYAYLLEGAKELLEKLYENHTLVLSTNGLSSVQRGRIEMSGIGKYFKEILISEEIGIQKPDAGYFAKGLEKLGFPQKEEVLVIGDSLSSDIMGAKNAGLDSCLFTNGKNPGAEEIAAMNPKPDYIAADYSEIEAVIEHGGKK